MWDSLKLLSPLGNMTVKGIIWTVKRFCSMDLCAGFQSCRQLFSLPEGMWPGRRFFPPQKLSRKLHVINARKSTSLSKHESQQAWTKSEHGVGVSWNDEPLSALPNWEWWWQWPHEGLAFFFWKPETVPCLSFRHSVSLLLLPLSRCYCPIFMTGYKQHAKIIISYTGGFATILSSEVGEPNKGHVTVQIFCWKWRFSFKALWSWRPVFMQQNTIPLPPVSCKRWD